MSEDSLHRKPKLLLPPSETPPVRRTSFAPKTEYGKKKEENPEACSSRTRHHSDKYDRLVVANPYARGGSYGGLTTSALSLGDPANGVALRRASFLPGIWEWYGSSSTESHKDKDGSSAINSYNLSSYHSVPKEFLTTCSTNITKKQAYKNVLVIGISFMFVYSAFISLQSLKSTMHPKSGLGVLSLSCMYTTTVISCFFAPFIIKRVSTKWTVVVAFILFSAYFTTHYYPFPEMIIPSSLILGLAIGPLWGAQATYLTSLALKYSQTTGQDGDYLVNKFLCIFCGLYQTSQIWGNLISVCLVSSLETQDSDQSSYVSSDETSGIIKTFQYTPQRYQQSETHLLRDYALPGTINETMKVRNCGVVMCKEMTDVAVFGAPFYGQLTETLPQHTVYLLVSIYLGCGVMAIVIATALLERFDSTDKEDVFTISAKQLCENTWEMLKDYRCQMLFPLIMFVGMQQAFMFGDFTRFYISCTLGVRRIGPIFICFGTISALSSIVIGYISKHIKRLAIVTAGAVFNIGLLLVLWLWRPLPIDLVNFFVVSGCLGLCDAIWQTQTYTLFGVLFMERQEAAFSMYRMFFSTGCALAFGYSHFLCVDTKVYILAATLVVSLLMYSVIEVKLQWQSQHIRDIVAL